MFCVLETACYGVHYTVGTEKDPRLVKQPGVVSVPLFVEICKAVEKTGVFAIPIELD